MSDFCDPPDCPLRYHTVIRLITSYYCVITFPFGQRSTAPNPTYTFYQNAGLGYSTLPMLRLLSSKAQRRKYFWKPSKPCNVGIHWKTFAANVQMSTHVPGFQSFFRSFAQFCIGQFATSSIRVKGETGLGQVFETGCPKLTIVKFLYCIFFQETQQYIWITTIHMHLLPEKRQYWISLFHVMGIILRWKYSIICWKLTFFWIHQRKF